MSRLLARSTQIALDVTVLVAALGLAFFVRFDWAPPAAMLERLVVALPYVVLIQYGLLAAFGVPRYAWRYVGLREALRILLALTLATVALTLVRAIALMGVTRLGLSERIVLPLGVVGIDYGVAFLGVTGIRIVRRLLAEREESKKRIGPVDGPVRTLLVGAGQAGALVARELSSRPDLGLRAVGFLDDDVMKHDTVIHGIAVLGSTDALIETARKTGAKEVLVTIAGAPGDVVRRIMSACETAGLQAKIIPGLYEIVGGQVNLSRIRPITIEDLLRRAPIHLDNESIRTVVAGKRVLVTGAGGSIGSELCRQACLYGAQALVLVEQAENNLFEIHRELATRFPAVRLVPCIADIRDAQRMSHLFETHSPDIVLHAAAHKHVPMMEWNPGEALKNNVLGTRLLADLADAHDVETFVMISTDKAVNPTSIMGASKRVAEMYVQALGGQSRTRFITVRFGNVLGSTGSVIPIFQEQIAAGGPVTVTHPDMRRYFMTIPEACELVLQSAGIGEGGEILILDMGEPVRIVDLARDLITLSGLRPDVDIEIRFTGARPGEKLFEELSVASEMADKTRHPKIFVGHWRAHPLSDTSRAIDALRELAERADADEIKLALQRIVPEFSPPEPPSAPAEPDKAPTLKGA